MRLFTGLGVLLLVVTCGAAIVRRNKRQLVPLAASCDMYATCAPPAVCMSGQCQCAQPYLAVASSCVAAYPRLMSPVLTSGTALHYLQPQQAPVVHSAGYLSATPVHYPAQMYQPPQPGYPAPQPAVPHPQPQPGHGYYPPHQQPSQPPPQPQGYSPPYQQPSQPSPQPEHPPVTYPVTDGYVSPSEPTTTTTQPRLYDQQPYIAYPGGFCRIPDTVCVGGSVCENNVCVCRRGEEPINGQCQRVEVPLVTESTTTTTSSPTTSTTSSTTTTTRPTTTTVSSTTTTPMTTTSPTTTTTSTAAPTTVRASTTATSTTTTTTAATTSTGGTTTTSQYIGRQEEYQAAPSRCVNCCPPGANNCSPQTIRINLSYPMAASNTRCQNSVDCRRGSFCRGGICR